jgi:hypothetical protein
LEHIKVDLVEARRYPVPHVGGDAETQEKLDGSSHGRRNTLLGASDWYAQSAVIKNRLDKVVTKRCDKFNKMKFADWLETLLPMCKWLRGYDCKTSFVNDLIAGISVGVMIVPQSMSYSKLAGLPVEYGLYSALMPVYAYSMFGSSRQLAVGPVALISLLLATDIDNIMSSLNLTKDDATYGQVYAQLALSCS